MTTATAPSPIPHRPWSTLAHGKGIYTTGMVARLCKVAPRTVSKWCDSGLLKHYKIPGSQDRRVTAAELYRFMQVYNYPIPPELISGGVLLVGFSGGVPEIGAPHDLAATAFEAGVRAATAPPAVIVVDVAAFGRLEAQALAAAASRLEPRPLLIAVWSVPVTGFDVSCLADDLADAVRGPRP